jgi:hypothetical protein
MSKHINNDYHREWLGLNQAAQRAIMTGGDRTKHPDDQVHCHNCKPVPVAKLDAANAEITKLRADLAAALALLREAHDEIDRWDDGKTGRRDFDLEARIDDLLNKYPCPPTSDQERMPMAIEVIRKGTCPKDRKVEGACYHCKAVMRWNASDGKRCWRSWEGREWNEIPCPECGSVVHGRYTDHPVQEP